MIRTTHISAAAAALLLGACAHTYDSTSTTYVKDRTAPAGTATYYSGSTGAAGTSSSSSSSSVYANPGAATTSGTTSTAPAAGGPTLSGFRSSMTPVVTRP